jgi:hypothetical protein
MTAALIAAFTLWPASTTASHRESESENYRQAKKIVYAVFPDRYQAYALRIVGCETGHTYSRWATGSAGEHGWFQIHPGNAGRMLYDPRTGKSIGRIDFSRTYQPWYNTRVAYFMSRGGRDWHEWTCSRYVN